MWSDRLFRYSAYDALPALCATFHVALLVATFILFHHLPAWILGLAFCAIVFVCLSGCDGSPMNISPSTCPSPTANPRRPIAAR